MIAYIRGIIKVIHKNNYIIIVNNDIGYEVHIKDYSIYKTDVSVTLWISTVQRETGTWLFGFENFEQREFFNKLILISGVGPKTAMLILAKYEPIEFYELIKQLHINRKLGAKVSVDIKGVGPNTANKIMDALLKEVDSS